jgi:hypothetical protein
MDPSNWSFVPLYYSVCWVFGPMNHGYDQRILETTTKAVKQIPPCRKRPMKVHANEDWFAKGVLV